MRLLADPSPQLQLLNSDLELVICIREESPPEVFVEEGKPKPDRHMLLGIMQTIVIAVEEMDRTFVEFSDDCSLKLAMNGEIREIDAELTIVRSVDGSFGAIVRGGARQARKLARRGERWFTGTIRLDIP
jgi:hypothetical protein